MSLTPKEQLEQINNPNLLSILSTVQGLPSQESLKHGAYVWKKLTAEGGDFVDFAVDNEPNKYPDGGEQGGYWYEKVVEGIDLLAATGFTKMAVDKFTLTSIPTGNYPQIIVSHSLGIAPLCVLVFSKTVTSDGIKVYVSGRTGANGTDGNYNFFYGAFKWFSGDYIIGAESSSSNAKPFNDQQISLFGNNYNSYLFETGVEYTLITMA